MGAILGLFTWGNIGSVFGGMFRSIWKAISGFLRSLNPQGVTGLCVAIALSLLSVHEWSESRHWHKQSDQYQKLYNKELANEAKVASEAQTMKARIDAQSSTISQKNKELNDAQNARIDADANAVRVRGPGKATCPGHSGLPAVSGGHEQTASPTSDAGPQMPSGDWAAVPWNWLVQVVEEHDQLLNEDQTWRRSDKQQRDAWPKPKP